MKFDLNCDLGEGEPLAKTRRLMRWITSANVACGGHAGTARSMETCVRLAAEFNVRVGAHPGVRSNFGRGKLEITPDELKTLLKEQVGAFEIVVRRTGLKLHHIKLHGSLYHATDQDNILAAAYLDTVRRLWPKVKIYARAGGLTAQLGRTRGIPVWEEVFADRGYRDDGSLVPRGLPGAVFGKAPGIARLMERLAQAGEIVSSTGKAIRLNAKTICIHSDTPGAVRIAGACRRFLEQGDKSFTT
jgi:5-oxoprolinase (ATP-hydrolysing) subunit A